MSGSGTQPIYTFQGFRLDAQRRILARGDGAPIPLAPKVFDALLYLVERPGQLLDKRQMIEAIWPNVIVEENNLNQAISTLRRVLGESPGQHRFIVTEPGRGYRFVATVGTGIEEVDTAHRPDTGGAAPKEEIRADVSARKRTRNLVITLSVIVLLAAIFAYFIGAQRTVLANSVAVLPLVDLSPDPANAYIAAGMHADIISQLPKLRGLNVINRDAVLRFASDRTSYSEIATALKVQTIPTGTFRYVDDQIHVNLALVDPRTDANLWVQDYKKDFQDILAVQADIAVNVAAALNAQLSPVEQQRIETRSTTDMEALRAYWRSFDFQESGARDEALRSLEHAIELDSRFALAYAQLALTYARSVINMLNLPAVSVELGEVERLVETNADKALEIDPELALPYVALGQLHTYSWRWIEAASDYAAAYERSPKDPLVLGFYSEFETFSGEYARAIPMAERVVELDPPRRDLQSPGSGSLYYLWLAYVYQGDTERALAALNDHLNLHPRQGPARLALGMVEARRGNSAEAANAFRSLEELFASMPRQSAAATTMANLAYGYSRIGDSQNAMRFYREVQKLADESFVDAGTLALANLAIGADQQALAWLDRAIAAIENEQPSAGWFSLMIIKHNATGDPVLEEPRYRERRERIRGS